MVKNTVGGSRHKSFARKQQNGDIAPQVIHYIRRADDGELYASAGKNFGGGRFGVLCSDGKERICVIRQKFKGRFRRGNDVSIGTYMLVGMRDWETEDTTCDLLCVYTTQEVNILKQDAAFKYDMLCVNEKKIEELNRGTNKLNLNKSQGMSGREKANSRQYIEDIVFDEEQDECEEIQEQERFKNVNKNIDYNINDYLEGIDEECDSSDNQEYNNGKRDEFGNYI